MDIFEKAKIALRKHLLENKEQVRKDLDEMRRKSKKANKIKRFIAYMRINLWGFCPHCNSSAPLLYDCPVCNYDTGSPFKKEKRRELWKKWKLLNL